MRKSRKLSQTQDFMIKHMEKTDYLILRNIKINSPDKKLKFEELPSFHQISCTLNPRNFFSEVENFENLKTKVANLEKELEIEKIKNSEFLEEKNKFLRVWEEKEREIILKNEILEILENKKEEIENLKLENERKKHELLEFESEIEGKNYQITEMFQELEKKTIENSGILEENQEKNKRMEEILNEINEKNNKINEKNNEINEKNNEISLLQKQLNELPKKIQIIFTEFLEAKESEFSNYIKIFNDFQNKINSIEIIMEKLEKNQLKKNSNAIEILEENSNLKEKNYLLSKENEELLFNLENFNNLQENIKEYNKDKEILNQKIQENEILRDKIFEITQENEKNKLKINENIKNEVILRKNLETEIQDILITFSEKNSKNTEEANKNLILAEKKVIDYQNTIEKQTYQLKNLQNNLSDQYEIQRKLTEKLDNSEILLTELSSQKDNLLQKDIIKTQELKSFKMEIEKLQLKIYEQNENFENEKIVIRTNIETEKEKKYLKEINFQENKIKLLENNIKNLEKELIISKNNKENEGKYTMAQMNYKEIEEMRKTMENYRKQFADMKEMQAKFSLERELYEEKIKILEGNEKSKQIKQFQSINLEKFDSLQDYRSYNSSDFVLSPTKNLEDLKIDSNFISLNSKQ